ncbi:hypothetical protein Taro_033749 [Colocasia esculenta]|uniref:Uncharacterized protein n=1 Tax=Colocasia esculenta TaxID=4460 RepID=A0A843WDE5_COLES|nr:hypothetical protein [Colocasia esculenta]
MEYETHSTVHPRGALVFRPAGDGKKVHTQQLSQQENAAAGDDATETQRYSTSRYQHCRDLYWCRDISLEDEEERLLDEEIEEEEGLEGVSLRFCPRIIKLSKSP